MRHGFVKVAAATPDIRVADVEFNTEKICEAIGEACENRAKILVFPELPGVCGRAAVRERQALQCGGGHEPRTGARLYDEDVSSELCGVL